MDQTNKILNIKMQEITWILGVVQTLLILNTFGVIADDEFENRSDINNNNLTIQISDYGIDLNDNNLYDFLVIEISVYVNRSGEYSLMGFLNDLNDREVIWSVDRRVISPGYNVMELLFDGRTIRHQKANGPFILKNLAFLDGSSFSKLYLCNYVSEAYITAPYNYSDFDI
jgi:hypothetical protein